MISTLLGYLIFGVVLIAITTLLTAYYVWRARSIGRRWWKKAERANDSDSKESK